MELTFDRWTNSTPQEREALARQLEKQLPMGFAFAGIERFAMGEQESDVARYQFQNTTFVLVPGGTFEIGFDHTDTWQPNPDEEESWDETAEEWETGLTIQEQVHAVTNRARIVNIAPLLVETVATELGWKSASLDHPLVQETLKDMGKSIHQQETMAGDMHVRVVRNADGSFTATQASLLVHADLAVMLQQSGFRFPTSDEWEYLCDAGAKTLFRWGDHVPCNHYPTDKKGVNYAPNALGLHIAVDPYKNEIVAEEGVTRGGDGGVTICGGSGFFAGWLTLATAYFEEHTCLYEPEGLQDLMGYIVGRRVLPLG
jgi:hypothetical protein